MTPLAAVAVPCCGSGAVRVKRQRVVVGVRAPGGDRDLRRAAGADVGRETGVRDAARGVVVGRVERVRLRVGRALAAGARRLVGEAVRRAAGGRRVGAEGARRVTGRAQRPVRRAHDLVGDLPRVRVRAVEAEAAGLARAQRDDRVGRAGRREARDDVEVVGRDRRLHAAVVACRVREVVGAGEAGGGGVAQRGRGPGGDGAVGGVALAHVDERVAVGIAAVAGEVERARRGGQHALRVEGVGRADGRPVEVRVDRDRDRHRVAVADRVRRLHRERVGPGRARVRGVVDAAGRVEVAQRALGGGRGSRSADRPAG